MAEKLKIATKSFTVEDGDNVKHATPAVTGVQFDFADGEAIVVDMNSLPEPMLRAAAAYGLSQKIGDSYSGAAKQDNPHEWAREQAENIVEQISGGLWVAVREGGGPRYSMLVEAIIRAAVAAGHDEPTPEQVKAKLASDESLQKNALQNLGIREAYAAIQAERAAAKAAKAAADAEGADDDGLGDFI